MVLKLGGTAGNRKRENFAISLLALTSEKCCIFKDFRFVFYIGLMS